MRCLLAIFAFSALPCLATIQGFLCVIELQSYQCFSDGVHPESGVELFHADWTGHYKRVVRYYPGRYPPVLASLGLHTMHDLWDNPRPPLDHVYTVYLCTGNFNFYTVDDSLDGFDGSPFHGDYLKPRYMTPIYDPSAGLPFNIQEGSYQGFYGGTNPNFGSGGDLGILQGNVNLGGGVPSYYSYDTSLTPHERSGEYQQDTYTFQYDPTTGKYIPVGVPDSASTPVDLTPVVTAVNNQGIYTRQQLIDLLGSAGNPWVYDCKLSLKQLSDIADAQGLLVRVSGLDTSLQSISSQINSQGQAIVSAIQSSGGGGSGGSVDVSALARESTLQSVDSKLSSIDNKSSDIAGVKGVLDSWNTGNNITYSASDFGNTTPDGELPDGFQSAAASFNSSVSQSLGTLVSWGDSGVPAAFDFDLISGILTRLVGTIPSVGSDSNMFSVDFNIPYVGRIQKNYSWADFPYIPEFRQFLLWCLYVSFAIAVYKLIHSSIF